MLKRLLELVTNPATGRLSTSDTMIICAFITTTVVLFYCTFSGQLNEWLFAAYGSFWVTQSQASKQASIKRDRTARSETDNV
jgi:hypothetical protein